MVTAQDSSPRKKAKNFDAECVIMGAELSDITINYARELHIMYLYKFFILSIIHSLIFIATAIK